MSVLWSQEIPLKLLVGELSLAHKPENGREAHLELALEVEMEHDSDPTTLLKEGDVDREGGGGEERRGGEAR